MEGRAPARLRMERCRRSVLRSFEARSTDRWRLAHAHFAAAGAAAVVESRHLILPLAGRPRDRLVRSGFPEKRAIGKPIDIAHIAIGLRAQWHDSRPKTHEGNLPR